MGAGAVTAEILKAQRGGTGILGPDLRSFFRKKNFARVDAFEDREEVLGFGLGGEEEFSGGEVEPGGLKVVFAKMEGEKEMVALGLDLVVGEAGTGRDDAGEFAFDEFAGGGCFNLVADRDFNALVEKFLNVIVGGVVWNARHGHAVAVGQGDPEVFCAAFGVLIEDFVEIPQSEKKEGIVRELGTDFVPLLHHGGDFLRLLGGHTLQKGSSIIDSYSYESKANFLLNEHDGVLFVGRHKKSVNFI
jgi:hypothetical protein